MFVFFLYFILYLLPTVHSKCNVLVLSGGGSYGAYEASIVETIANHRGGGGDDDWDIVTGVSAGSINALYISTYPVGELDTTAFKPLWTSIRNEDILSLEYFLNGISLYSTDALLRTLEGIFDNRSIHRKISVGATSLSMSKNVVFTERDLLGAASANIDLQYIMASTAIPIAFPPQKINDDILIDGGLTGNILLWEGIERCEDEIGFVDVVLCIPVESDPSYGVPDQSINIINLITPLIKTIMNQIEYPELIRDETHCVESIQINVYQPQTDIHINFLDFTKADELWALGKTNVETTVLYLCTTKD